MTETGGKETFHRVVVDAASSGERIDRALAVALPEISRSRVKQLIEAGRVHLDDRTVTQPSHKVKAGAVLAVRVPEPVATEPQGEAMALSILYEDEHLIVIDKPAGLVVHPAAGHETGTLVNALIAHCGESLQGIGGVKRPGIVHRLDKDTSGVMVAAKTEPAHKGLTEIFAARDLDRHYTAVVWGLPAPVAGEIEGAIGRDPRNRKKMAVVESGGREAITRYRVDRALAEGAASVVDCKLLTGRTHQIRVHFAHIGHALIGDPLYGRASRQRLMRLSEAARRAVRAFPRQALHAKSLSFRHPQTGEILTFDTNLPQDIADLIFSLETL